jgi:hypothetical protein
LQLGVTTRIFDVWQLEYFFVSFEPEIEIFLPKHENPDIRGERTPGFPD